MSSGSSLRDFDRLADRVRQHRQSSNKPLIVVEGPDDQLTLAPVLPGIDIFPADGKRNAIDACVRLVNWNLARFACVVDEDLYDQAVPRELLARYYPYLEADLEAMLISIGVLEELLVHIGSVAKLQACGGAGGLIETVCVNVAAVTSLRQQNAIQGWGLNFDDVDLASKIDKRSLELQLNSYCMALLRASSSQTSATQALLLEAAGRTPTGPYRFRGKDVVAIVGVALRAKAGSLPHTATAEKLLCANLRSSAGLRLSQSEWLRGLCERLDT